MELGQVIQNMYESEINCEVSTFWDAGFLVKLGDYVNGFVAETHVRTAAEAAVWLTTAAKEHFPESAFSLGQEEWERRARRTKSRHEKPGRRE
jgi:hypothetical protein